MQDVVKLKRFIELDIYTRAARSVHDQVVTLRTTYNDYDLADSPQRHIIYEYLHEQHEAMASILPVSPANEHDLIQ
jgi:hypothetical protein